MKRLLLASLLWCSPVFAESIYLRCDFRDWDGPGPSAGAVDLVLNESQSTVTSKIWDLGPGYTSPAFFGPEAIEYEAVKKGGPSMYLDRKRGWLLPTGGTSIRACKEMPVPKGRKF